MAILHGTVPELIELLAAKDVRIKELEAQLISWGATCYLCGGAMSVLVNDPATGHDLWEDCPNCPTPLATGAYQP